MKTSVLSSYTTIVFLFISCNNQKLHSQKMQSKKPKNIILMIEDGMGLSQISAAMYQKQLIVNGGSSIYWSY